MIKIVYLYFVIVSNVTETPLFAERLAVYRDMPSCRTALGQARKKAAGGNHDLRAQVWGKNVRQEFDCKSVLVGTDDGRFSTGVKPKLNKDMET